MFLLLNKLKLLNGKQCSNSMEMLFFKCEKEKLDIVGYVKLLCMFLIL